METGLAPEDLLGRSFLQILANRLGSIRLKPDTTRTRMSHAPRPVACGVRL